MNRKGVDGVNHHFLSVRGDLSKHTAAPAFFPETLADRAFSRLLFVPCPKNRRPCYLTSIFLAGRGRKYWHVQRRLPAYLFRTVLRSQGGHCYLLIRWLTSEVGCAVYFSNSSGVHSLIVFLMSWEPKKYKEIARN